jgi:hypothetical protein
VDAAEVALAKLPPSAAADALAGATHHLLDGAVVSDQRANAR